MSIVLKNISKSYEGRPVLKNISATLEDGGFTCITGTSGVGKTTLLNILAGIARPDSGEISDLDAYKKVSVVFQEDRLLLWFDAIKNIEFVLPKNPDSKKSVRQILRSLNLTDDDMKKNVSELSGGMRRRVEIGRALAYDFDLLLLDEPFKGLDDATKFTVIDRILEFCHKKTVVMITHDLDDIRYINEKTPVNTINLLQAV